MQNPDVVKEMGEWFLNELLRKIVRRHHETIRVGRLIEKHEIYLAMSQWHHCSQEQTRTVMRLLTRARPEIVWSNRGLWIPKECITSTLLRGSPAPGEKTTDDSGGGANGVEA